MTEVFNAYAAYYDLLYQDKDYAGEARYVRDLIQRHAPGAVSILELGCGTGAHAACLAGEGYHLYGIDRSSIMLQAAELRRSRLAPQLRQRLRFSQGDIREVCLEERFDAVISLFHVISYQTTNADLQAAFATAGHHLKPGGLFIFDVWYGPAVLTDRPTVRVKRLENDAVQVVRIAEPMLRPNENLVDVGYHVFVRDRRTEAVHELREIHTMRYLFLPELEFLLQQAGLGIVSAQEWLTWKSPDFETWGVCCVVRK